MKLQSITDYAAANKITRQAVYKRIKSGKIKAIKVGKITLVKL